MKTNKLLSSLITVFTAVVLFAPSSALAAAFGVSPPWIENDHVKPGTNFVYVINLSASDLSSDMMVQTTLEGSPEIAKWFNVQNKDNIRLTTGKSLYPMYINVNIPEDAKTGEYKGKLKLALVDTNGRPNGVTNLLGGNIAVDLNVVDYDVNDFWVKEIKVDPIQEGQSVNLRMDVKNLGNVAINKVRTKASIIDMDSGAVVATGEAEELSGPIQPQTLASVQMSIPTPGVGAGFYWIDVESFKGNESVYKNRLTLQVAKRNAMNNAVETGVMVSHDAGNMINAGNMKNAAPVPGSPGGIFQPKRGSGTDVATAVTVRAPIAEELIIVVIGILLILTGILGKFYFSFKKRKR